VTTEQADPYGPTNTAEYLAGMPTDLASKAVARYDRHELARYQHYMAHVGRALGQCPTCWAYRADGQPPQLHVAGAPCADQDGRAL
jgi:hypothetical protein